HPHPLPRDAGVGSSRIPFRTTGPPAGQQIRQVEDDSPDGGLGAVAPQSGGTAGDCAARPPALLAGSASDRHHGLGLPGTRPPPYVGSIADVHARLTAALPLR